MKMISRETMQLILDTARIEEVVADFVSLKKRGSGYIGLCPFHNERTPSFSVSPSKGICKCFSCGKGGSAVNFIMELEQMSFGEALRYLATKYHIDIKEEEASEEELQAENDRASLFAINEFAAKYYTSILHENPDGRAIGLSYFRERGINDRMIERFQLGYALDRNTIAEAAHQKGFTNKYLIDSGLCILRDNGEMYDRFKGRVIYPVRTVSGKVVAFGGRTLRTDKNVAKYVNSPDSPIYHKQNELYGLYQAKQAISRHDKCILVEGYMDVISMHQVGVENVVASSGTSLTTQQVRLIHRFTNNVTLIYDADSAGIKASLRGIDMLLAEGLDVKLLLLPPGEDPDSFARSHTANEVENYISANETDFITFKTKVLLEESGSDPMARAKVINAVVESISVIPDTIARDAYVRETSRLLGVDEGVLNRQAAKYIAKRLEAEAKNRIRVRNRRDAGLERDDGTPVDDNEPLSDEIIEIARRAGTNSPDGEAMTPNLQKRYVECQKAVLRYAAKYGALYVCDGTDSAGNDVEMNLLEYVSAEMEADEMRFSVPAFTALFTECQRIINDRYKEDLEREREIVGRDTAAKLNEWRSQMEVEGDLQTLQNNEALLKSRAEDYYRERMLEFQKGYIERRLASNSNDTIRHLANELIPEKYVLSKLHSKYSTVVREEEKLYDLVQRALVEWRDVLLIHRINTLNAKMKELGEQHQLSEEKLREILSEIHELMECRRTLAQFIGERVVSQR